MTDAFRRLRELEQAATPGPWQWREHKLHHGDAAVFIDMAETDLIVAARNALPLLLDIVEAGFSCADQCEDMAAVAAWNSAVDALHAALDGREPR